MGFHPLELRRKVGNGSVAARFGPGFPDGAQEWDGTRLSFGNARKFVFEDFVNEMLSLFIEPGERDGKLIKHRQI